MRSPNYVKTMLDYLEMTNNNKTSHCDRADEGALSNSSRENALGSRLKSLLRITILIAQK